MNNFFFILILMHYGLKKYAYIAQKKLLLYIINNKLLANDIFELTDILPENITLLIYKKTNLSNLTPQAIIPSLYDSGFYFVTNPLNINSENIYISELMNRFVLEQRSNISNNHPKLNLKVISEKYQNIPYINNLYQDILPTNKSPFFRFFAIYQIVETLMLFASDAIFFNTITSYNKKGINKNELKERFRNISKEIELIRKIYESMPISHNYYTDFNNDVEKLLNVMNKETNDLNNFQDYMYKLWNIIVHEMRSIVPYQNEMTTIVDTFEKIIFILLRDCVVHECHKKDLFVVDKEASFKTNKKKLRKFYQED